MENWKDIPGYEGRYQVSDLGRVRSVDRYVRCVDKLGVERTRLARGQVLRPGLCREYPIVNLSPDGTIAVHLLVAHAFVEGRRPGLEVNHKDGVKANCRADNLEWMTKSGNQQHALHMGLRPQAVRVVHPVTGEVFPSINYAARAARCRAATVRATWARA